VTDTLQQRGTRTGFTLVELLLVTIIIGILASIAAPFVQAARDKALVAAARADLRNIQNAIESYVTMESRWPTTLTDLTDKDYFTSTPNVSVCYFIPIPASSWRPASVLLLLAHEGSTTMVYTLYPMYNGKVVEFTTSALGCAF
jgi:prepilin-type N-terminal cleavage/methylation domain-containing protein